MSEQEGRSEERVGMARLLLRDFVFIDLHSRIFKARQGILICVSGGEPLWQGLFLRGEVACMYAERKAPHRQGDVEKVVACNYCSLNKNQIVTVFA